MHAMKMEKPNLIPLGLTPPDLDGLIEEREGWFSVHRDAFRDPAVFELEMRHIFEATWNFVGLDAQVPNTNDYLTTTIGRSPSAP